jgi:hypothetical protein
MEQDRWLVLFFKAEKYISNHEIIKAKETYTALLEEISNDLKEGHVEVFHYTNKLIHRLCKYYYFEEALELFETIRHYDTADETLLKIMRVCDDKNSKFNDYEALCNRLENVIAQYSSQKGNSLIFWQCRQHLSNILLRANLESRAYQLRQELWNYELADGLKNSKYSEGFRKQLNKLKNIKNTDMDFNERIKLYQSFFKLLKGKILQGCTRHKQAYTVINNMAFGVYGPKNKTSRFILSEMQKLVYEEGWYDWCTYLKGKKEILEPVNFVQCRACSRIRPLTIEECSCNQTA